MIIIGEKINGTIDEVLCAIRDRNGRYIGELARAQAEAGADYVDVNVGIANRGVDEAESMTWALGVVQEATDKPVALDSADPRVLSKGLQMCAGSKPFLNSVSGEKQRLEGILPLAAEHGCRVIALAMDESGIPASPGERLEVCYGVLVATDRAGIPREDVYFDPLILPVGADCSQGRIALDALSLIKRELGECKTVIGLSNISYGLPGRSLLNRTLLAAAVYLGLDAAVMDSTDRELISALFASEVVAGSDDFCRRYVKAYREGLLT